MKLIALMMVRNEEWVIEASMRAALEWCDGIAVLDHGSIDRTQAIIDEMIQQFPTRIGWWWNSGAPNWDEMDQRQDLLEKAREFFRAPTHFALIDADEILTANYRKTIRPTIDQLQPGMVLRLPMIPTWRTLDEYRDDSSVWSKAMISVAFADRPDLCWKPTGGYQHHNRQPHGSVCIDTLGSEKRSGGVMHLQFANWTRLTQKHVWYRMVEQLRWPGRKSPSALNAMYDQAITENGLKTTAVPPSWWGDEKGLIANEQETTWFDAEIRRMLDDHGRETFAGLDLKGY